MEIIRGRSSDNEFAGIFGRFFELRQKTARTDNIQEIIDAFTLADLFFSFPKKTLAFLVKDFAHETCYINFDEFSSYKATHFFLGGAAANSKKQLNLPSFSSLTTKRHSDSPSP